MTARGVPALRAGKIDLGPGGQATGPSRRGLARCEAGVTLAAGDRAIEASIPALRSAGVRLESRSGKLVVGDEPTGATGATTMNAGKSHPAEPVTIAVGQGEQVSGLVRLPPRAQACFVLAHGAGAGMTYPFLDAISAELAERDIATLRFQFRFMERGSKRPDSPAAAQAVVRAAVATASELCPKLPLVAGGRSFGGRMTSQAQAAAELPAVIGLAFLGFPLHPAKRPSTERALHLFAVNVPMLFVQGTRDDLADLPQLRPVCDELGARATLRLIDDADHSFHVRSRSGRSDLAVRGEIADLLAAWMAALVGR